MDTSARQEASISFCLVVFHAVRRSTTDHENVLAWHE